MTSWELAEVVTAREPVPAWDVPRLLEVTVVAVDPDAIALIVVTLGVPATVGLIIIRLLKSGPDVALLQRGY